MGTTIMTSAMWQSTMAEAPVRPNIASTTPSHSANTWMTNWRMEKSHAVCVTREAVTRSIEIWSLLLGYRTSSITLLCVHIFLGECCEHSLRSFSLSLSLFYVRHVFAVEHNVMRWRISCNREKIPVSMLGVCGEIESLLNFQPPRALWLWLYGYLRHSYHTNVTTY